MINNKEKREMKRLEFIEEMKDIKVGIIRFEYGESEKELGSYNDFAIYNKMVRRLSYEVFHRTSKEEYSKNKIREYIKNEYGNKQKLTKSYEEWFSIQELWKRFENNDINVLSFEIEELQKYSSL